MGKNNITLEDLHKDSDLMCAACLMVEAHNEHGTSSPALKQVRESYPGVRADYLVVLWIGINEKDKKEKDRRDKELSRIRAVLCGNRSSFADEVGRPGAAGGGQYADTTCL